MFQTLKRLYDAGRLNEAGLQNAVNKGWITQAQFNLIKG
ncbi:XkdX family protein [Chengkuizengella sp. SCS-71B]